MTVEVSGESFSTIEDLSKIEVKVLKSEPSIEPAFLLPINAPAGLFNVVSDFINLPPLKLPDTMPFTKMLVMEKSFIMLLHGFLSMHLHITMQFSICHHPDLLTIIVIELWEKSIANAYWK